MKENHHNTTEMPEKELCYEIPNNIGIEIVKGFIRQSINLINQNEKELAISNLKFILKRI